MRRLTGGGSSVVEDCKVQLAQACRIGDHLNLNDLVVPDREIEDEVQTFTRRHNSCHGSIYKSRSCALSTSDELLGNDRRASDRACRAILYGNMVGAELNLRVEHCEQRLKFSGARGSKEGINHCSLAFEIGMLRRFRSPHAAACATRELPCCVWGTLHDRRNLVERHREDVVQH